MSNLHYFIPEGCIKAFGISKTQYVQTSRYIRYTIQLYSRVVL